MRRNRPVRPVQRQHSKAPTAGKGQVSLGCSGAERWIWVHCGASLGLDATNEKTAPEFPQDGLFILRWPKFQAKSVQP